MTANGYEISFGGYEISFGGSENVLKLYCDEVCTTL